VPALRREGKEVGGGEGGGGLRKGEGKWGGWMEELLSGDPDFAPVLLVPGCQEGRGMRKRRLEGGVGVGRWVDGWRKRRRGEQEPSLPHRRAVIDEAPRTYTDTYLA